MKGYVGVSKSKEGRGDKNWPHLVRIIPLYFPTDRLTEAATWIFMVLISKEGGRGGVVPHNWPGVVNMETNYLHHQHNF